MVREENYWTHARLSRRRLLASGTAVGAAALLIACGGGGREETAGPGPQTSRQDGQPRRGGTLHYHLPKEPGNLDPHLQTDSSTTAFSNLVYNGLLGFKRGPDVDVTSTELVPELAQSWETPDPSTVILKLRPDVKWHNVAPLNAREFVAEDAKFALQRLGTNRPEFQRASFFRGIDTIETPDPQTVRIKHKSPNVPFPTYLAVSYHKMLPREVVEQDGDAKTRMVGTGPFVLENFTRGGKAVFKRNPEYWNQGRPYVDAVELTGVLEPAARVSAFRAGETDAIFEIRVSDVSSIKQAARNVQEEKFTPFLYSMPFGFDVTRAPFNDVRVRQAIALVIDHPGLRRALFEDEAVRLLPIPVGFKEWLADPKDLDFYQDKADLNRAKQLMSAAGMDGGFKTVLDTNTSYSDNIEAMPLLQRMLRQINIDVTDLKRIEPASFLGPTNQPGGFEMRIWNHNAFSEPDEFLSNFYVPGASRNYGGWGNDKVAAMIERQRSITDEAERKKVIVDIQKELATENWRIGLEQRYEFVLWQRRLKGFKPLAADPGYYTIGFDSAWLEG